MALTKATYSMIDGAQYNVRDYGAVGDGVADDRAACQAAITAAANAGGGDVVFPSGIYRIVGTPAGDGTLSGIVIPFGGFSIDGRVRLIGTGDSIIRAASDNMYLVRVCQPGSELHNLTIEGGWNIGSGFTNTVGIGLVPENQTQTTTLVSQSFCKVVGCHVTQCSEGLILQPGPTVSGSGSGAYYPVIERNDFNFNGRHMWFRPAANDPTNRPTRGTIAYNRIERGNCGIDLQYVTEFNLIGNKYQFFNTTYNQATIPSVPFVDSRAIRIGPLTEFVQILGDFSEAQTNFIVNESTFPSAFQFIGILPGTSVNIGGVPQFDYTNVRVTNAGSTGDQQVAFVGKNNSFGRLVFDYDANNVKTAVIETNAVERMRWFNGITTHFGSSADVVMTATGTTRPSADNAIDLGTAAPLAWRNIYSNNALNVVSDPRSKTDIQDTPLGLDFINALRPVSYKFKVGSQVVKEVVEIEPAQYDENGELIRPAVTEKVYEAVPGKRVHYGLLTTGVKAAADAAGVDFGGYVKGDLDDPESQEFLRYDEFIAPLIKAVQELSTRVAELESKLNP
jgi:hypothetical protein